MHRFTGPDRWSFKLTALLLGGAWLFPLRLSAHDEQAHSSHRPLAQADAPAAQPQPTRPNKSVKEDNPVKPAKGKADRPLTEDSKSRSVNDAKNRVTNVPAVPYDPQYEPYGIYERTAPRAEKTDPRTTQLPLKLQAGAKIALIGNTLLDREQHFGHVEALIYQKFPQLGLAIRNLSWSADEIGLQPRPENFADREQHLVHEKADVILAAFGFNESFAGEGGLAAFRGQLGDYLAGLKTKAFNGKSGPLIVLISPIANENVLRIPAADMNNDRLAKYVAVMEAVAREQQVGFVNVFNATREAMESPGSDLTVNGAHLNAEGYALFANVLFKGLFGEEPPRIDDSVRQAVVDKEAQYSRRYRPLNSFYYTGGRSKDYGYLDFLPAMRNFDLMVANREQRIADMAAGKAVPEKPDDSNLPPLPETMQSRGANEWMTAAEELKAFEIDPRFEVNLFAGEEQFPEIANPIQMRWDARGRLWVSCSTTYPHVYPGFEPNDKLVILEDVDGDGRADKSTVFADDLHIPLSFEFGDGGVYCSEMPDLTFLKDTNGDDRCDVRERVLTGFGTEDSHHALHDFTWTPDGDLLWRESIFHHSQVETPYGPVRQQNSGWFRFQPRNQRLISFGTYHSTNPWGVTFDDWGQHVASHPIYAAAFHSLDPPYPTQHPAPAGLRAYSGTCGHDFVGTPAFPEELQGSFIKARYKPTNRIEIHKWVEGEFGFDEEYVTDLIFSTNLSFIPVDVKFGPRGDLYVCDWYNPVKGHAQYSLRDERRDRESGRIWRVTAKGKTLSDLPKIAGAPVNDLLNLLKRPEYEVRLSTKRELRERDANEVRRALDAWVTKLDPADPRYRHHQLEALWTYRWIGGADLSVPPELTSAAVPVQPSEYTSSSAETPAASMPAPHRLLRDLIACDDHHARAAATQQLRYWHPQLRDAVSLLRTSANDENGIVRMEAAIAASYLGTQEALDAMLDVLKYPREGHLNYAITCAIDSAALRRHWEGKPEYKLASLIKQAGRDQRLKEPTPGAGDAQFDTQPNLKTVRIGCVPERMRYTVEQFAVTVGQPVKIVFTNPDATDHNLLIVQPEALEEVGMAANAMAKDRKNANSDFIPEEKRPLILQAAPMIGPTRKAQVAVLRFKAPREPGIYPYVCTFPGHWVIMRGDMVVAESLDQVPAMLAAAKPQIVQEWKMADFPGISARDDEETMMRGMQAFAKARCNQCHLHSGHGVNLGPDLTKIGERFQGEKLLRQVLEPSAEINKQYQPWQFITNEGQAITGVIQKEDGEGIHVIANLLTPDVVTVVPHGTIEVKRPGTISSMPEGLANVLSRKEIEDLVSFLQMGGYKMPPHLEGHGRQHGTPAPAGGTAPHH